MSVPVSGELPADIRRVLSMLVFNMPSWKNTSESETLIPSVGVTGYICPIPGVSPVPIDSAIF